MSTSHTGNIQPTIDQEEHRSVNGVNAKAVAAYGFSGSNLVPLKTSSTGALVSGLDYDYVDIQQTNATTDTYVFKTGGSGGTTVRTVTVVYTSSAKTDLDNVSWS